MFCWNKSYTGHVLKYYVRGKKNRKCTSEFAMELMPAYNGVIILYASRGKIPKHTYTKVFLLRVDSHALHKKPLNTSTVFHPYSSRFTKFHYSHEKKISVYSEHATGNALLCYWDRINIQHISASVNPNSARTHMTRMLFYIYEICRILTQVNNYDPPSPFSAHKSDFYLQPRSRAGLPRALGVFVLRWLRQKKCFLCEFICDWEFENSVLKCLIYLNKNVTNKCSLTFLSVYFLEVTADWIFRTVFNNRRRYRDIREPRAGLHVIPVMWLQLLRTELYCIFISLNSQPTCPPIQTLS